MRLRANFSSLFLQLFNYARRTANRRDHCCQGRRNYGIQCPKTPSYKTRVALPRDYNNVLRFMNESYYKHEPVLVNIGLENLDPVPASLQKLMCDQIKEGMTIIAEDREKCILGAAVNVGSCPWEPEESVQFARCCERGPVRDVIEFFAYVTSKPNLWDRYCVLKIFECSSVAVAEEFQGLGIGRRLIQESWYLARDCGYRLFRIDCTSRYTARIAEDLGWEKVCAIPFCRYVRDGQMVFKNIKKPHTEVQVYIDRVTYCKTYCLPCKNPKKRFKPKSRKNQENGI